MPTYVLVGMYRLFMDESLYVPAWKKCKHATAFFTFKLQRKFIEIFFAKHHFGLPIPFDLPTYATILLLTWAQMLASRGKGPEFWGLYVKEWDVPPSVDLDDKRQPGLAWATRWLGLFIIKKVLLTMFSFYPFIGIFITAWFKALGTVHGLHNQYFDTKEKTLHQISVFMEEHKWDYQIFGFTATLLEGLPFVELVFTVSNRIGAAMWAHSLFSLHHFL
ncbi:hypothetical protein L208DRAFT_1426825 [Tricholoma matsutake]|nr:hypothetical protein L208DRAFT_1426825 [Tricholoma matsutake 945]